MTGKKSFQCSMGEVLFEKPPNRHLGVMACTNQPDYNLFVLD